jgi:hypothetical protein
MRPLFTSIVALAIAASAWPQLTAAERKGVADALYLANLTTDDLRFERRPFNDQYRLRMVDASLIDPFQSADELMALHAGATLNTSSMLQMIRQAVFQEEHRPFPGLAANVDSIPYNVPVSMRGSVASLAAAVSHASANVRKATEKLSADERRDLIESLPRWAAEAPNLKFDFVRRPQLSQSRMLELLGRVNLNLIRQASVDLAASVESEIAVLQRTAKAASFSGLTKFEVGGVKVAFAGIGSNAHADRDAVLTIDLGGNDEYTGRHGAGIGYSSVLIDLGGDDRYETPDASLGTGLLGIGLAYDLGGDDQVKAGSLSLGSGLAGVGLWRKSGGFDTYRGRALTQGFGEFGIGLCVDSGGDDHWSAQLYAQGAARTQGIGWLADLAGGDTYQAGGFMLNSPLFSDVHYSNAQGFASGYRDDLGGISGGMGLLTDLKGVDHYLGETYCQAASYWFSIGSLYDADGHDTYRAYHYAQSSAMHMTSAFLFDLRGDDLYGMGYGAAHAIGHDYGVAVLLDRAGNDNYAGRDSRPGIGNANGLAVFIDGDGEDRYMGPPGIGNASRDSGSIGLFVDLNGPDRYADGLTDGGAAIGSNWGIAFDAETNVVSQGQPIPAESGVEPPLLPGSIPKPDDAAMEHAYSRATQWAVGTAQAEVAANVRQLIRIGMPAVEWMIAHKLQKANRLEIRAFVSVISGVGESARNAIALKVADPNDEVALNALRISVDGGFKEAGPLVMAALERPALRRLAARAAGVLEARAAVAALLTASIDKDKLTALNAITSLAKLKDPMAFSTAQALLDSKDVQIRKAALQVLAQSPEQAEAVGLSMLAEREERRSRLGIELLGLAATKAGDEAIAKALLDDRPGVRIQALLALNGRFTPENRGILFTLQRDPHPLVRATALQVDPGR